MFTKANEKLSVGFSRVWPSQHLYKSELFDLHSESHVQVASIIYLGHGLLQTSLFPWENIPSPSCDGDLERGQPGASRLDCYRGRCACLASQFFRDVWFLLALFYSTMCAKSVT